MSDFNSNIFDLSALPQVNSPAEPQSLNLPEDISAGRFEAVYQNMIENESANSGREKSAKASNQAAEVVKQAQADKNDKTDNTQIRYDSQLDNRNDDTKNAAVNKSNTGKLVNDLKTVTRVANSIKGNSKANSAELAASKKPTTNIVMPTSERMPELTTSVTAKKLQSLLGGLKSKQAVNLTDSRLTTVNANESQIEMPLNSKFTIDNIQINGDRVEITAHADQAELTDVKIIIPKDQLVQAVRSNPETASPIEAALGQKVARVPLDGMPEQDVKLNDLLTKLNLKEIEVKADQNSSSQIDAPNKLAKAATFKLTSSDSSTPIIVKGQIQSTESRQRLVSRKRIAPKGGDLLAAQKTQAAPVGQKAANGRVSLVNTRAADGGMILKAVKVRAEAVTLIDKFIPDATSIEAIADQAISGTTSAGSGQSSSQVGSRIEMPQVKMTLPDDLSQAMKTGGKAVTIKIDPEILGPVRLSIRMNGNQLTARLMVDSVQVKSMIEGSLNQLTEQLEQAGIKVEQVAVDVAGSDVGSELFEKTPAWTKPKMSMRALDAEEQALLTETVIPTTPPVQNSIQAGSVNIIA